MNPTSKKGEFSDVSLVEKFEITATEYNNRSDSVRAFKLRNKLGRQLNMNKFDKRFADKNEEEEQRVADEFMAEAAGIVVGERCLVEAIEGGMGKRGLVMFVGKVEFKPGFWVGVKYDEPVGKHNGT